MNDTQVLALAHTLSLGNDRRKICLGLVANIINDHAHEFVGLFYESFMKDEEAANFLNQSTVHSRLSGSLRRWLQSLADFDPHANLSGFEEQQKAIGEVHARIKIPVHLVLEGASLLKREASRRMIDMAGADAMHAIILLNEIVDFAMLHMSMAYVTRTAERVQVDEAYRLFSLGQDVGLERETQKAVLMEWSQMVLFAMLGNLPKAQLEPLSASPFGLWVRHRAAVMFGGSMMLKRIEQAIAEIDGELLPNIKASNDITLAVARLQTLIEEIKFLLSDLFQSLSAAANARDPLTSALTRRFLPSIIGREVALANAEKTPLTLLMIDIDHFKKINDGWGHSAGDFALRQMAETIMGNIRPSDYVFRYGGEEFLVALLEADQDEGYAIAERIRTAFELVDLQVGDGQTIRATLSIGVAAHQGHPDYQQLIDAADKAMYEAKAGGRNRTRTA